MKRSQSRLSRFLVAAVIVVIAFGALITWRNRHRTHLRAQGPTADKIVAPTPPLAALIAPTTQAQPSPATDLHAKDQQDVLITTTPPVTQPGGVTLVANAATRPAGGIPVVHLASPVPPTSGARANHEVAAATAFKPDSLSAVGPVSPTVSPASTPTATSTQTLRNARAKQDAGEPLAARAILNDALIGGHLDGADADTARQMLGELNKTLIFSARRFDDDSFAAAYKVQSGERLSTIAARNSVSWQLLCRINGIDAKHLRAGSTIKVLHGPFNAVVNKSKFRMDLYLGVAEEPGSLFVASVPVGLGKDSSTPTGKWEIATKILHPRYYSPRGEGVIDANDPKNPLGGYWIGLSGLDGQAVGKTSYGIHGTIDPSSIGKQESMGCIRLGAEDIALVYDLLLEGKSKVIVKD